MTFTRLLGATTAVAALMAGAAMAQQPATSPTEPPAVSASPTAPAAPPQAAPAASGQLVAKGDIVETLKADGRFTTFVKALDTTNMTQVLKTNSNLTVFAPTDAAFAALPAGQLDGLMKDPPALQKLLTFHVINATVDSTKIKGAKGGVKTVAGSDLLLDGTGERPMAGAAVIAQADVKATNGTVHVVDKVLTPGAAASASASASTGVTTDAAAVEPAEPTKTEASPQADPPAKAAPDIPPGEKPKGS